MHKAALIAVAGFTLMGAYYAFGTNQQLYETTDRVADHQHEVLARNAALAGYNQAKQHLSESFTSTSIDSEFEGRDVEVTVTVDGDEADIVSTGTSLNTHGGFVPYKVQARILRTGNDPDYVPPFMDYCIFSAAELDVGGRVEVSGNVQGWVWASDGDTAELNCNVHTNGSLHVHGNSARFEGFATHGGNAVFNPRRAAERTFAPNYNPSGLDAVQQVDAIDVPAFDPATYLAGETVDRTTNGDVTLSGTIDLGGTREDPYIWRIRGNLDATGNTVVNGYVLFVVEGNMTFAGNLTAGATGYAGSESNAAFYATGRASLAGNVTVHGQIFANGDVSFEGTPSLYGTLTSRGSVSLGGTPKFYYQSASPALADVFEENGRQFELVSYNEW